MSLLLNKLLFKKDLNIHKVLAFYVVNRGASHWYPQYKPGPYPKTQEERERAAKKYNLLPEEYEPYPDDGSGLGDYPNLPRESPDNKDPWYPWDEPYLRKDYLEPLHRDFMLLQPELYSTAPEKVTIKQALVVASIILGAIALGIYTFCQFETINPVTQRQIWRPNVVHYSFDLDTSKKAPPPEPPVEEETHSHARGLSLPFFFPMSSKYMKY